MDHELDFTNEKFDSNFFFDNIPRDDIQNKPIKVKRASITKKGNVTITVFCNMRPSESNFSNYKFG